MRIDLVHILNRPYVMLRFLAREGEPRSNFSPKILSLPTFINETLNGASNTHCTVIIS